jgi:peptide/nickel transport system permease protein
MTVQPTASTENGQPLRLSSASRLKIRLLLASRGIREGWAVFRRNPLGLLGLALIVLFLLMPVAYTYLSENVWAPRIYDPEMGFDFELLHPTPPGPGHLLGTDVTGRDVLSVLLASSAHTLTVGASAALVAALIGILVGAISAYFRGRWIDQVFISLADTLLLLPAPLMMIILGSRFRELSAWQFGLIYGAMLGFGSVGMGLRSLGLTIIARPFIQAARIAGGGRMHIIFHHLVPHLVPMTVLYMMVAVTGAVVADGFVSFFGFLRSTTNWGSMVFNAMTLGTQQMGVIQWNVLLPPAMSLSLFAGAFYFVSIGLQDVINPRLRQSR